MDPRRLKIVLWLVILGTLLLLGLTAATAFVLPAYVESRLIPQLTGPLGLTAREVRVRRIGWLGADLGPIQYTAGDVPVISVAAIHVDYSPVSLVRGRILGISLGGARVALTAGQQGLSVPGMTLPPAADAAKSDGPAIPDMRDMLPIGLNRLRILQSEVEVTWNQRRFSIPLSMTLDGSRLHQGLLEARGDITLLGNPLAISARLDQKANEIRWTVTGDGLALESLAQTGMLPADLSLSGAANLTLAGRIGLQPFEAALEMTARVTDARIAASHAAITNQAGAPLLGTQSGAAPVRPPIVVKLKFDTRTGALWSCAPLHVVTPVAAVVETLAGEWQPDDSGWTMTAAMTTRLPTQNLANLAALPRPFEIQWSAKAAQQADGPVTFQINATADGPLELKNDMARLTQTGWRIDLNGRYAQSSLTADATGGARNTQVHLADGHAKFSGPSLTGRTKWNPGAAGTDAEVTAKVAMSNLQSKFGSARARFPKCSISADGQSAADGPWKFKVELKTDNGRVNEKKSALALTDIDVRLPLHWPLEGRGRPGRVNIGAMAWKKRQLGDIKGTLKQNGMGLDLDLKHRSKLFPQMIVYINGGMHEQVLQVNARLPDYRLSGAMDLGQFAPQASGLALSGRVEGDAQLKFAPGSVHTAARLKLQQAGLRDPVRDIELEGIATEITLEDVLNIRSAPQQKLRVERLRFGKLSAAALALDFQLEPDQVLFIEKAGLDWSRGRVNTAAIRIVPGKDDYDVTLFCDRLNLAMVLEQLGAAEASGDGSVNGRIPLRWTDGRLSFDNGFLYSTPGQTGAIQLSGTEVLLAGLPPGTPQHTQLDIATEALKDYTYNWARLSLTSEEDNLLLKLKFDGKPNRLLPFAYDQSLGQFKRVTGQGQAEFKGISIDLNFTSPLNDIIHYKEFLK